MRVTLRLVAVLACLVSGGCTTSNVNPQAPRAKTGYVDFYTDSDLGLSWKVKRGSNQGGELRRVFWEFKPVEGNILRLAAPAGTHRFEVWFSNEVTTGPQIVVVEVANAKVTPLHVTLAPKGSVTVVGQSYEYRPTARATRRVTKVGTEEQEVFQIGTSAGTPQVYQLKEWMPYFRPAAK